MSPVQVAVGVIKNSQGKILISLRHESLHQGGLWEFPGGKLEITETAEQALSRELKEELNITVTSATPLITINHHYPDLAVQLHVFLVEQYSGEAKSCEGQPFKWVTPTELKFYNFPKANLPIITAASLPPYYAILDDVSDALLLSKLNMILNKGVKLIQIRLKKLSGETVTKFLEQAYPLCKQQQAVLLINSAVDYSGKADGIHLTSSHLMALTQRPVNSQYLAASCHNLEQLHHAQKIGVDFAVLAPVMPTLTHPGVSSLGWEQFSELIAQVNLPIYALGGLTTSNLSTARQNGAQGIAAIRAFWD
jgi:8-oxo-dGTP diphosphatase